MKTLLTFFCILFFQCISAQAPYTPYTEEDRLKKNNELLRWARNMKTRLSNGDVALVNKKDLKDLENLRRFHASYNGKVSVMTTSLVRSQNYGNGLEKNVRALNEEIKKLKREIKTLTTKGQESSRRCRDLQNQLNNEVKNKEKLESQISELTQKNSELELLIQNLRTENQEYRRLIADYENEKREHIRRILELEFKLFQREEEVYKCQTVINELGSYAGFGITSNNIFFSIKDNQKKKKKAKKVRKKDLTITSTYYHPYKDREVRGSMIPDGHFVLYKGDMQILDKSFVLTKVPYNSSYDPSNFLVSRSPTLPLRSSLLAEEGELFMTTALVNARQIKNLKLKKGNYTYEIYVNGNLLVREKFRFL